MFKLNPSSIQPATLTDRLEELEKTMPYLNRKRVEVEGLKRTIVTRNDKIHVS